METTNKNKYAIYILGIIILVSFVFSMLGFLPQSYPALGSIPGLSTFINFLTSVIGLVVYFSEKNKLGADKGALKFLLVVSTVSLIAKAALILIGMYNFMHTSW